MAPVRKWVAAPVDDVWAILADARSYAQWVVGSHDIVGLTGDWPQVGSTFRHVQGHGPVKLTDTTTVLECEPGRRLLLEVRIRPLLVGPVELILAPDRGGTCVTIDERAEGGVAGAVPQFLTSPLIAARNAEGLRRLSAMAWARAAALDHLPSEVGADLKAGAAAS